MTEEKPASVLVGRILDWSAVVSPVYAEDEVLVIGESKEGGVAAGKVFGGTRGEFRKTLEEQQALIPAERVLGCLS